MNLLGFYLGLHDSNVALVRDGALQYFMAERMAQVKHHYEPMAWVEAVCEGAGFVPDAIAFTDGNRNGLGICEPPLLWQKVPDMSICGRHAPAYCLDHHHAHTLSAWPLVSIQDVDYGVTIDGKGDHSIRVSVVHQPGAAHAVPLMRSREHAYCHFLALIGWTMGLDGNKMDLAGKVMGAHSYGEVDEDFLAAHHREEVGVMPVSLLDHIPWRGKPPAAHPGFFNFENPSFRDWLATVHTLIGRFIADVFTENVPPTARVVYAGGGAQNTVYNEWLFSHYPNLVVPPHCYDGGLSLGCVEFLRALLDQPAFSTDGFPFWQSDPHGGFASSPTIERVAHHIAEGKIVGWFQGRGEIGPRALGHRSILLDASRPDGKDHLNTTVKRREHWRPYAGSIPVSNMDEVVESSIPSPYMLRAIPVSDDARASVPAIVHVDRTSRVQTLAADDPEVASFAELVAVTRELAGTPAILNTSMNAAGKPIASTPEQALELWRTTPMEVLCIGDTLWEK